MEKGNYVVMTCGYTTGCGKVYLEGHIGYLCESIDDNDYGNVDVRFPTHSLHDSSWIPARKFKVADDQLKAEKLFKKGELLCKKVFYK